MEQARKEMHDRITTLEGKAARCAAEIDELHEEIARAELEHERLTSLINQYRSVVDLLPKTVLTKILKV